MQVTLGQRYGRASRLNPLTPTVNRATARLRLGAGTLRQSYGSIAPGLSAVFNRRLGSGYACLTEPFKYLTEAGFNGKTLKMEVRWRAVSTVINYSVVRPSVLTMEEVMTLPIDDPRLFVDLDVLDGNLVARLNKALDEGVLDPMARSVLLSNETGLKLFDEISRVVVEGALLFVRPRRRRA